METRETGKILPVVVIVQLVVLTLRVTAQEDGLDTTDFRPETPTNADNVPCPTMAARWIVRAMYEAQMCITETGDIEYERKRVKENPVLKQVNLLCIMKCVAVRLGLLNEKAEADTITITDFVSSEVPVKFTDIANDVFGGCMPQAVSVNSSEIDCRSYAPLFRCIADGAKKVRERCMVIRGAQYAKILE